MKLFIDIVMERIYLFNIVAWNYRKKIGFPVCKKENFAGLEGHRNRGKSARASPTPHHTLNEERSARFTAQPLSVLAVTFPLRPPRLAFAICGWRWQNDVHEIKYSVCVCVYNYVKSAYLYLQLMCDLHKTHPDVHKSFQDGLHIVRKSDRYWSRLSTDLVIEQVLMRSLKRSGELTRGRGMTEAQRLAWVMSMPACAEVNGAMQNPTDIVNNTSEQHKEATKARQERGHKDTHEIVTFLSLRNRFRAHPSLRSITTGIVAEDKVNADKAKEVGEKILSSLTGKNVYDHSFRRKDQVVTMASKAAVKFHDGKIQVDPQLLFQRLSIIATGGRFDNPKSLFKHEMCSYPHALFDTSLLPRKANKPALADAVWTDVKNTSSEATGNVNFVLDGGALIHRVSWHRSFTCDAVYSVYVQCVIQRYGKAMVVFDGYKNGPSTKDCTHQRRTSLSTPTVAFDSSMLLR